jgi:hypothetical protein
VQSPAGNTIASYTMAVAQTAGQANILYQPVTGAVTDTVVGSTHFYPNIFNGLVLPAGSKIILNSLGTNGAGDAFLNPEVTTTTGLGNVWIMPLRDGGNAVAQSVGWKLAPGDVLEVKSQAGIEAVSAAGDSVTVQVFEELFGAEPGEPSLAQ